MEKMITKLLEADQLSVALAAIVLLVLLMLAPQVKRHLAGRTERVPTIPPPVVENVSLARFERHVKRVDVLASDFSQMLLREQASVSDSRALTTRVGSLEIQTADHSREWRTLERQIIEAQESLKATRDKTEELCERIDGMKDDMREDFRGIHERLDLLFKNGGNS